jgi:GMP synthase (glutamine-hydrolysing)
MAAWTDAYGLPQIYEKKRLYQVLAACFDPGNDIAFPRFDPSSSIHYMKKSFIIKAGSTYATTGSRLGDFEDWVIAGMGVDRSMVDVVDVAGGAPLPPVERIAGAAVTGSHAMVTDNLPWSIAIERWIVELIDAEVPFLGICYGHQLLGRAAGGVVGYHPGGREVGMVPVRLTGEAGEDPLFRGVPECFPAHAAHAQSVLRLPPDAVRLAGNSFEPNHAFRVGRCAWGVQFHPEYSAGVMKASIEAQRGDLEKACRNVQGMLDTVTETPDARMLLRNFASLACQAN